MLDRERISKATLDWIQSFIIEYTICPFAKGPVNKKTLRIAVSASTKQADALNDLVAEMQLLDEHPKVETSLLVFGQAFADFFSFVDFIQDAEELIQQLDYEGIYQIATFHPLYFFADTDTHDVIHYLHRSPYPMVHLLREDQLEKAIEAFGDTSQITTRNTVTLQQLGVDKMKQLLLAIKN
jgi:hypothetical protein